MLCLSSALFIGCKDEPDPDPVIPNTGDDQNKLNQNLIGTWVSEYFDGYTITNTRLSYDDGGYGYDYAGDIKHVINFTNTSGVIFFQYDTNPSDTPTIGKINGVYYENLKSTSVEMGTASNADYTNPAKNTLDEAIATFTMGNKDTYIAYTGTYLKQ
jgi:hypothetical protein